MLAMIDGRVALFLSTINNRDATDIPYEICLGELTPFTKEQLFNLAIMIQTSEHLVL